MQPTEYDRSFFQSTADQVTESARHTVPVLMQLLSPRSVIDVGCGTGRWLDVFRQVGVAEIMGVDGDYVVRTDLAIPLERFVSRDLRSGLFTVPGAFDLAVSLEVAEHLPEESALPFVQSLAALAPVVAFSAAVPGQGGVSHVNEQWPDYWAAQFAKVGYVAVDAIRHRVWNDQRIAWYYRQNLVLYIRKDQLPQYPALQPEFDLLAGRPLSFLHPDMYAGLYHGSQPENSTVKGAARFFFATLKAAIGRRLRTK